jgi:hypothetical protein
MPLCGLYRQTRIEYLSGPGAGSGALEVQAKSGLRRSAELWDALMSLSRGLDDDPWLRWALLVDHEASRSVRNEHRLDIERLAQGHSDRLRSVTHEVLEKLEAQGIAPKRVRAREAFRDRGRSRKSVRGRSCSARLAL